jgi:hypothetical protein
MKAKKKATKTATPAEITEAQTLPGLDKQLAFETGWDQQSLPDAELDKLRELLRSRFGASSIDTEKHTTRNVIAGKTRKRQTAIFFVHTVTGGRLEAAGKTYAPRKGQMVVLPAGSSFAVFPTSQNREIIEFTF